MRRIARAIRKADGDEAFLAAQIHVQQASTIAQRLLLRSREAP
jgi:hypothetical protein